MTDVGNQLLTKAQDVGVAIDSLVISNNNPNGDLSKLDESFFDTKILINAKNIQGNTLQVEAVLNNDNFNANYPVNVVGITAHMKGNNDSVLLAVAKADEPEVIPASADIKYTQYFDFSITNDKQANITAEINPSGIVSNDAFSNAVNSLTSANDNNVSSLNSDINSLSATDSNNATSLSSAVNSLSTADSSNANSLSSAVSSLSSSDNLNFDMLSGLIGNYALASLVDSQFENYATNSSVAAQIANTESYANSVAVSAAIGSTNWVNTLSTGTDLNTTTGVGRYVLLPNGNYGNFPASLDSTKEAYMDVIPDQYGNASQHLMAIGSHVQAIRFKQPSGWTGWSITATLDDTNNAYQNAVNTASAYTNQKVQSVVNTIKSNIASQLNGYNSPITLPSCDLNNVINSGVYQLVYTNSYADVPNKSFIGANALLNVERESNNIYQTIKRGATNTICYRSNNSFNNNWNSWSTLNP